MCGQGRGGAGDEILEGNFLGIWKTIDGTITMRHAVRISCGTMYFDIVAARAETRELAIKALALK